MISYAIARVLASRSLPSEAIYGGSTLMGVEREPIPSGIGGFGYWL